MASSRRAVFTGVGAACPIGLDNASYWDALMAGRSGVRPIQSFDAGGLPIRFAGEVPDFDPKKYLDKQGRKSLRVMARSIQLAVAAAQLALDDSAIDKEKLDATRFGVEFGSGLMNSELEELGVAAQISANCQPNTVDLEKWGETGIPNIQPLWMLKYLPNMLACHVSILHNAQGPNNTIIESDAAGLLAIGEGYRILSRDQADFILVGGGESKLRPLCLVRHCLFQPLSKLNENPEKASRPFDKKHEGMVIGEGATVLCLEEAEHAQKRGARIYAELVGFGAAFDRQRNGAGLARAIRAALKEAGVGPEDIDHINAHGTSAVEHDVWEARGIAEVFGDRPTPVFAAKSYFGNLGAGTGVTEMVASLLALQHGVLPPTLNFEERDPACPITVAAGGPRPVTKPYFLKLGFADMGQCAALVCKKWGA